MTNATELNTILEGVTVEDPIKTIFNPSFKFIVGGDCLVRLSIKIDTIWVGTGKNVKGFEANFGVTAYECSRFQRDPLKLAQFVRQKLIEFIAHEVDESMFFGGTHVKVPYHWGPSDADMQRIRTEAP